MLLHNRLLKGFRRRPVSMGWREWVALPELGIPAIKAKIDTGARTSALHAEHIQPFERDGKKWITFIVHPLQNKKKPKLHCEAEVVEQRTVTSSTGNSQERYIIRTTLKAGKRKKEIEISLTNRKKMKFRMLLGRTALTGFARIYPEGDYLTGTGLASAYRRNTK